MTRQPSPSNQAARGEEGAAAIEFAFVFPVLLMLFFGLINLTQYISTVRKANVASQLVTDLVARQTAQGTNAATIDGKTLEDYFVAVELLFSPMDKQWVKDNVGIDIYNYAKTPTATPLRWSKFYGGTAKCSTPTVDMGNVDDPVVDLLNTSDVIVAVVCTTFALPVANFPGFHYLANKRIESYAYQRPRETDMLKCTTNPC